MDKENKKVGNTLRDKAVIGVAVTVLSGIILFIVFGFISSWVNEYRQLKTDLKQIEDDVKRVYSTSTIQLASVNYTSEISGDTSGGFYLGFGSIKGSVSEKQYYVAYKVLEDGGKKLFKMPAEITVIYDTLDSDSQAYAEIDMNIHEDMLGIKLFVHKDTIVQDYDLSLID